MRDQVFNIVKEAVDELNEELRYDTLKDVKDETPLFGGDDSIDSLSLVNLIVNVEGRVKNGLGKEVILADEKAMSMRNSPYRNVGALVTFVLSKLQPQEVPA